MDSKQISNAKNQIDDGWTPEVGGTIRFGKYNWLILDIMHLGGGFGHPALFINL
jgi:hypothetical protein